MFCANVSHVISQIWGNFQGKVCGEFAYIIDGEFRRPPALIENPGLKFSVFLFIVGFKFVYNEVNESHTFKGIARIVYEFSLSDYTVFSSLLLTVGDLCCIKYANQFSGNMGTTTFSPCP